MAIDIAAKLAELRAKKALENKNEDEKKEIAITPKVQTQSQAMETTSNEQKPSNSITSTIQNQLPSITESKTELAIGTTRTSEIDHLAFLSKHQELSEAILHHHPRMPILLMEIHKHLREDPELVTTLSEEQIAVIVNGLKIQTKTELVGTIVKQAKSRDKKTKISLDML